MVQDELLRMRVQFEAGALLAFEAAITLDEVQREPDRRTWLRLSTALAKYLAAEYAITSSRAALELVGGNGYTSDYPLARLLRDAQVLTVWEGPANIQALELLRLLSPKYKGWEEYRSRMVEIVQSLPDELSFLLSPLEARLKEDAEWVATTTRDDSLTPALRPQTAAPPQRESRLRPSLRSGQAEARTGNELQRYAAWRYLEEIAPPPLGSESQKARKAVLELLEQDSMSSAKPAVGNGWIADNCSVRATVAESGERLVWDCLRLRLLSTAIRARLSDRADQMV